MPQAHSLAFPLFIFYKSFNYIVDAFFVISCNFNLGDFYEGKLPSSMFVDCM